MMKRGLLTVCLVLGLMFSKVQGQDSLNVSKIGLWMTEWDATYHLAVRDNHAFIANETGLAVMDITDPHTPVQLAFLTLSSGAQHVALYGDYICVAAGDSGLCVVDISDPEHPFQVARLPLEGNNTWITIQATWAFLIGQWGVGMNIVDLSDPLQPVLLSTTPIGGNSVAVLRNNACICDGGQLHVVDVSDPINPVEVGSMSIWESGSRCATVGNGLIYLLDPGFAQITVVDISDPTHPHQLNLYSVPLAFPRAIAISGHVLYISSFDSGVCLVDISDPQNPSLLSQYYAQGFGSGLAVQGDLLVATRNMAGLEILDLSEAQIISLATYAPSGEIWTLRVADNRAYLAEMGAGLRLVDITNPSSPEALGFFFCPIAWRMTVRGNYVYFSDTDELHIIDVSNPDDPVEAGSFVLSGFICDLEADSQYLFISKLIDGLIIMDVSDPAHPLQVGTWDPNTSYGDIELYGNYLYLSCYPTGIRILDISNPAQIIEVGSYNQNCQDMDLSNNKLYIFTGTSSNTYVQILDLIDPFNPVPLGCYAISWLSALAAEQDFFIATWGNGDQYNLQVVNATNPVSPFMTGCYTEYSNSIQLQGNYAYLEEGGRMGIYDVSAALPVLPENPISRPESFQLFTCHPNPFNASTVISYELQTVSKVSLEVYDTAGRLVATLVDGWSPAGTHDATFDGTGLASGIYLARLEVSGSGAAPTTEVQKLVLMK